MKLKLFKACILVISIGTIASTSCKKNNDDTTTVTPEVPVTQGAVDISTVVTQKFVTGFVTVTTSGTNLVLKSDGRPNHKTPYWGVGNVQYEAFPAGHATNPGGQILPQNYTMTIPAKPAGASTHEATGLGPIGMALNGVAIFNNVEMGGVAIDAGIISSFDGAGAHPAQVGNYHYHVTGTYTSLDDNKLVGFLRDGFPLIGRKDMNGTYPTNLDAYNGHTAATTEFPNGIYHYHIENVNYLNTGYYILKSGSYYGTKGTFVF
jgi:hypothetical protein